MPQKQFNDKLFNIIAGIVVISVAVAYYWLVTKFGGFPLK